MKLDTVVSAINWEIVLSAFARSPDAVKLPRFNPKYPSVFRRWSDGHAGDRSILIGDLINVGDEHNEKWARKISIRTKGLVLEGTVSFPENMYPELNEFIESLTKDDTNAAPVRIPTVDLLALLEKFLFENVIGVKDYSILKMDKGYFIVKGSKRDILGKGSFAKVKDTAVYFPEGVTPFEVPSDGLAVRSTRSSRDSELMAAYAITVENNLDGSFARASRRKNASVERRYVLLEKARSNLYDWLAQLYSSGRYDENLMWMIAFSTVRAIYELHQKGIAHRDIKSENFLVYSNDRIALSDFDFVRRNIRRPESAAPTMGSRMALPDLTRTVRIAAEQYDEYATRRFLRLTEKPNVMYLNPNPNMQKWGQARKGNFPTVFSENYLKTKGVFSLVLDNDQGIVSSRSLGELLCLLILERNNLLSQQLADDADQVKMLMPVLLSYQEKNREGILPPDASELIRRICDSPEQTTLLDELRMSLSGGQETVVSPSRNGQAFMPQPQQRAASDNPWQEFDDLMNEPEAQRKSCFTPAASA